MHIPDNYLSPSTCAVMGAAMVPVWAIAAKKVKKELTSAKVPLLGIGAAFSFLLMMFNVPLPGGTTGHAVGGTLIAILLGPWSACISVTVALVLQALLFGDGGILAIGANCFNMAFVLPFVGYFAYRFISERFSSTAGKTIAVLLGSYFAIVVASLFAAVEFGIQPLLFTDAAGLPLYCPYPLSVSIPAMVIPHMLIAGVVEAAFTVAILTFVQKTSPGSVYESGKERIGAVYGLVIALICLSPIGLLATGTAWGEWGLDEIGKVISNGKELGFVPSGMEKGFAFNPFFPDYEVHGLPAWTGYIVSAIIGAAFLIILFKISALIIRKLKSASA
ncbi:MAG TPA: cobalt transporter CbiM [Spirochaetota bacterium]|nr:cobalt transporter CbiM [Spirochaetota bacterium]